MRISHYAPGPIRRERQAYALTSKIRNYARVTHAQKPEQKFWLAIQDHGIRICRTEIAGCQDAIKSRCPNRKLMK